MIKARGENRNKTYGIEVINTTNLAEETSIMLTSNWPFFLEGVSGIIREKLGNTKVIREVSKENIIGRLTETKPQLLLLDNRSFRLNLDNLLSFITEKSPDTKVILFGSCTGYQSDLSNVIHLNKETISSELISIINRETLGWDGKNGVKKSSVRLLCTAHRSC